MTELQVKDPSSQVGLMRLSASSLKEFTKCGYQFYLKRMLNQTEPGKYAYGMLHGRVIGKTMADASAYLNQQKTLPDHTLANLFGSAFEVEFAKAGVPYDIVPYIRELLTDGASPGLMSELYALSESINVSNYQLKIPARKKNGELSEDKRKPTFGAIVQNSLLDLQWYFDEESERYTAIRDAALLDHEVKFEFQLAEGVVVDGYIDQLRGTPDGGIVVEEFKSDKTAYTDTFVQKMIQAVTYQMAYPQALVRVADISHQTIYPVKITEQMLELTQKRYLEMARALRNHIYIPACGTDPFRDKQILCGFKCGGCPFGDAASEEEEAA